MPLEKTSADLLWKHYEMWVGLYKFYLELALKANTFYFGITGALVAYVLKTPTAPLLKFALLLPIVMGISIAGVFWYGSRQIALYGDDLAHTAEQLGFQTSPDLNVIVLVLRFFAVILLLVSVAIGVMLVVY